METIGRDHPERKLAAIMAADIAGYSRLIGADEEGTLDRIRSIRAEVIDPVMAADRGRLVKTTGDGLLVEFASVVDALRTKNPLSQMNNTDFKNAASIIRYQNTRLAARRNLFKICVR
jgi:class 3 adenylate cyclase